MTTEPPIQCTAKVTPTRRELRFELPEAKRLDPVKARRACELLGLGAYFDRETAEMVFWREVEV